MKIIEILKKFFNNLRRNKKQLLLNSPENINDNEINKDEEITEGSGKIQGIKRGIYTKGVIELLKNDIENPETFKKYILKEEDVPESQYLEYKLDYIFENVNKYTNYDEQKIDDKSFYLNIGKELLNEEEFSKIEVSTIFDKEKEETNTLLKINQYNGNNLAYILNRENNTFKKI